MATLPQRARKGEQAKRSDHPTYAESGERIDNGSELSSTLSTSIELG